jgi:regulator of sigma E protease
VIVFTHEYGHFLAAKKVGVAITRFSIGIGPEIFGKTDKHGTRWCLSLFPIGGYVMMLGDEDISSTMASEESCKDLSKEEKKKSFHYKSNWEKILIAFCGPLFNYIYAFVVLFFMSIFNGIPTYEPVIGGIQEGSPAERCGLKTGDRVLAVAGKRVEGFREITTQIAEIESPKITFQIVRDGKQQEVDIAIERKETRNLIGRIKKTKVVGIKSGKPIFVKKGVFESLATAANECIRATAEMMTIFPKLFAGKKSLDDFGGVIRIAEVVADLSKGGSIALLVMFTVSLSINLGFINLFPLPILDGGTILLSALEQITGRKINKRFLEYVMMVCAFLLISLMVLMTVNDALRLDVIKKFVLSIME